MKRVAAAMTAMIFTATGAFAQDLAADRAKLKAAADTRQAARETLQKDKAAGNAAALPLDRQRLQQARSGFQEGRMQTRADREKVHAELAPMRQKLEGDREKSREDRARLEAARAAGNPQEVQAARQALHADREQRVHDRQQLHEARAAHGLRQGRDHGGGGGRHAR